MEGLDRKSFHLMGSFFSVLEIPSVNSATFLGSIVANKAPAFWYSF